MAEPFKNLLNQSVIENMSSQFKTQWPQFNANRFISTATNNLDSLELKARSVQITDAMIEYLPANFEEAGRILMASLGAPMDDTISEDTADDKGITGWAIMPMTHYVGLCGHDHFDLSMTLFKEMTKRETSEFGIRFFILAQPEKTLSVLKTWATDKNRHVRRLVSEGSRPRLPWAMRLPLYIENPSPVIELLELLKDDSEEYVRRSVANNLNDIAKDHPDLVSDIAARWMKDASHNRKRLIKHACRTLIKNGHKKTLKVLGFKPPKFKQASIEIMTPEVIFGDALQFTFTITSNYKIDQSLMIDYIIHHQKANGKTSPKVFKWRIINLAANNTLTSTKKHVIKSITTRAYYPGLHTVEIMVNGVSAGKANFELLIP